ncbi:YaiI/YqxD family protein [Legionella tunisiensis]|uniref:YaiI/YqxD family protein n=1 Tax=Legionella tunisiensis TaxID=1034944 RepID=UPI0002ECFD7B|nr:YaiI/YqxD family protein [Legionella tunisiensis]
MKIWVDADACPNVVKDILFRAAERTRTNLILVANTFLIIPHSQFITTVRVEKGFDAADNYIVQQVVANDLVITADIPLAAAIIAKQGLALNPRGELYTANDIKQRLGLRDMMEQLRSGGLNIGGPTTYSTKETASFANALDRILARIK